MKSDVQPTKPDIPAFLRKAKPQTIEGQALAELVGLPRICRLRKCRRAKACLGVDLSCLTDLAGVGVRRWRAIPVRRRDAELARRIEENALAATADFPPPTPTRLRCRTRPA